MQIKDNEELVLIGTPETNILEARAFPGFDATTTPTTAFSVTGSATASKN